MRATLARWPRDGVVSRIGAVFRPGSIGVSTLAALAVPPADLARVAALVSARPEVNHNYEREHRYNLWFVADGGRSRPRSPRRSTAIGRETGYAPISLPLRRRLLDRSRFRPRRGAVGQARIARHRGGAGGRAPMVALSDADRRLIAALEGGLPLVPARMRRSPTTAGVSEAYVLVRLADWLNRGVIKRLGVVVRHRELGYVANAMCVWDVPDGRTRAGRRAGRGAGARAGRHPLLPPRAGAARMAVQPVLHAARTRSRDGRKPRVADLVRRART